MEGQSHRIESVVSPARQAVASLLSRALERIRPEDSPGEIDQYTMTAGGFQSIDAAGRSFEQVAAGLPDDVLALDMDRVATLFDRTGVPQTELPVAINRDAAYSALEMLLEVSEDQTHDIPFLAHLQKNVLGEKDEAGYTPFFRTLETARSDGSFMQVDFGVTEEEVLERMLHIPNGAMTYRNTHNVWEAYADLGPSPKTPNVKNVWMAHCTEPSKYNANLSLTIGFRPDLLSGNIEGLSRLAMLDQYVSEFPHRPLEDVLDKGSNGASSAVYRLSNELMFMPQLDMTNGKVNFVVTPFDMDGGYGKHKGKDIFYEEAVMQQVAIVQEFFPQLVEDTLTILGAEGLPPIQIEPVINDLDGMSEVFISNTFGVEPDQLDVPVQLTDEVQIEMYKDLTTHKPTHTFEMIGGLKEELDMVKGLADKYKIADRLSRAGSTAQSRLLLRGKPGSGKTMIAEAVANYLGGPFLRATPKDLGSKYVNEGERFVSAIFQTAAKIATPDKPVVLFFDELDVSTSNRSDGGSHEAHERALGQLLNEMNARYPNVFIIGATNAAEAIDDALVRPGRFNHHIDVPLPTEEVIAEIIEKRVAYHVKESKGRLPVEDAIDYSVLASSANKLGMDGAGIAVAINEAIDAGELENERNGIADPALLTQDRILAELERVMKDRTKEKVVGFAGN